MNKLYVLENMGFRISWKLIVIGLLGNDEIPQSITRFDVLEYLDGLLTDINEHTEDIITLVYLKDDFTEFENVLKKLAREDASDIVIQKRKWRAFLLKDLIDNINEDCLQGLLELMEFWVLMGKPKDCPLIFPIIDKKAGKDYFTQSSYEFNLDKNRKWLDEEIQSIVNLER